MLSRFFWAASCLSLIALLSGSLLSSSLAISRSSLISRMLLRSMIGALAGRELWRILAWGRSRELCTQPWARSPAAHSRCSPFNLSGARGAGGWCTWCPSAWTWRGSHSGAWPGWTPCHWSSSRPSGKYRQVLTARDKNLSQTYSRPAAFWQGAGCWWYSSEGLCPLLASWRWRGWQGGYRQICHGIIWTRHRLVPMYSLRWSP